MRTPEDLHRLIDPDRLVDRTVELIGIPSVNPFGTHGNDTTGEQAVARWLADHLDRLGFEPAITEPEPGRANVVGLGPGGDGPVLALAGHTDTVGVDGYDRPFRAVVERGRIHGRGACDMKGALAAFIEVAEVLASSRDRLRGRLMIVGTADEEHAMIGSRALGAAGPIADHVIVGEPTELRICSGHKGQFAFSIQTFGRAVHSSIADRGVNAIEHMMEIVEMLRAYRIELADGPGHGLCGVATVSPGVIEGGRVPSIVPDHCQLQVDRRLLPGEDATLVAEEIRQRIASLAEGRPEFRWRLGPTIIDAAPLDTDRGAPIVTAAGEAFAAVAAREPLAAGPATPKPGVVLSAEPVAFTGATDAPNLGGSAIIWGPGSLAQAHTTDEWLDIGQLSVATHLYLRTALQMLG